MANKMETIFWDIYKCSTAKELETYVNSMPQVFGNSDNWKPLGGLENNFSVVENQQSNPIAAVIEKITNSIDAILMKKCLEFGIDPKSESAPQSMQEAIETFFLGSYKDWDLSSFRKVQSEEIQIIADGPRMDTSLIIYDNGEGQHPEDFESTFLSLIKGNKNDIKFVQGKYNMGGSGSIVFCGGQRYQLIASKKYTNDGKFGFTLIRKHPLTEKEQTTKKNTWYEYLVIDGKIPKFQISTLDLGIYNRKFTTGTIIKMYSYDLPSGVKSVISRDLNQSINEYLFEPVLPVLTVDKKERYPKDRNLERDLYGLKRRLNDNEKYIEEYFSIKVEDKNTGPYTVYCYVFNTRIDDKNAKESKESIRREFFKNGMSVLFSINGQVHGHYTSEFITKTLKYNLLKEFLLIHVDCSNMRYDFRSELFMASRDRLKGGQESGFLRDQLKTHLLKSELAEIYKERKNKVSFEGSDTKDLLKSLSKSLPMDSELAKLFNQAWKIEQEKDKKDKKENKKNHKTEKEKTTYEGSRYPAIFDVKANEIEGKKTVLLPVGGEKTIKFDTDVEDNYFSRTSDPGELRIEILERDKNEAEGGDPPGKPNKVQDIFAVTKSDSRNGQIKVSIAPSKDLDVGEEIELKVSMSNPEGDLESVFWVKLVEKENKEPSKAEEENIDFDQLGLPEYIPVYQEKKNQETCWDDLEAQGVEMDFNTIMHPVVSEDSLESIFINMDSKELKNYKRNLSSEEQFELADKRYITSVYFHTLFLYTINKKMGFSIEKEDEIIELGEYLKQIFSNYYTGFLMNFGMSDLIDNIG